MKWAKSFVGYGAATELGYMNWPLRQALAA
jgi:hypothetical protein